MKKQTREEIEHLLLFLFSLGLALILMFGGTRYDNEQDERIDALETRVAE